MKKPFDSVKNFKRGVPIRYHEAPRLIFQADSVSVQPVVLCQKYFSEMLN